MHNLPSKITRLHEKMTMQDLETDHLVMGGRQIQQCRDARGPRGTRKAFISKLDGEQRDRFYMSIVQFYTF